VNGYNGDYLVRATVTEKILGKTAIFKFNKGFGVIEE